MNVRHAGQRVQESNRASSAQEKERCEAATAEHVKDADRLGNRRAVAPRNASSQILHRNRMQNGHETDKYGKPLLRTETSAAVAILSAGELPLEAPTLTAAALRRVIHRRPLTEDLRRLPRQLADRRMLQGGSPRFVNVQMDLREAITAAHVATSWQLWPETLLYESLIAAHLQVKLPSIGALGGRVDKLPHRAVVQPPVLDHEHAP